ncbi:hypothetical protein ISCGN_026032 [Ixodes scapularis]
MAADDGRWTSTSELSFTVPANSVFLRKRNFGPIKRTHIHPVRHARPASRLHEDVAEPSSLLVAEDIARSNVKHEERYFELNMHPYGFFTSIGQSVQLMSDQYDELLVHVSHEDKEISQIIIKKNWIPLKSENNPVGPTSLCRTLMTLNGRAEN